ncbi:MAG: hypothetical protein L6R39_004250 [Caloplaca ligustica]|nr:MAG: hypothetical protein L6R39_004250 [Caloplaca ligustica]
MVGRDWRYRPSSDLSQLGQQLVYSAPRSCAGMEPVEEFRTGLNSVFALSLGANTPGHVSPQMEAIPSDSRSPLVRKIVVGILFSRRFILSYQLVLLGLLMIFTIRHWASRFRVQSRRKQVSARTQVWSRESPAEDQRGGYSSSSSTVVGGLPSPKASVIDGDSERIPLLPHGTHRRPGWQMVFKVRAFLVYQPSPIPWVNRTLPSNGATLAVIAFLGLQAFYLFYRLPLSIPMLFVFADRTSLLFVANLPLLYLFAAKNQPVKLLTGFSYESLNILHRRLGEVMCLLAFLHSVGMFGVWYTILRPTGFSLARFSLSKIILLGIGAFVAYELLYLTSLGSFRQRWYELFLAMHVFLQVVALVLVWFHHHNSRPYVGTALAIFFVDRLLYRMALKVQTSRAWLEVCKDDGTVIVHTKIILVQNRRLLAYCAGVGITKGWKPTEHCFLTVPALSRKHIVQAHPFTIASKAPHDDHTVANLQFIIRAKDGFSSDLLKYAKGHSSVNVRIDGPYGSQNAFQLLQQCDISAVIAGGSGIAVALPLVWALCTLNRHIDVEGRGKKGSPSRIVLIWVIHSKSHTAWVGSSSLETLRDNGVEVILPPPTDENGHPDIQSMLSSWLTICDDTLFDGQAKAGIVCSGPDGMTRVVRNTCSSLLDHGRNVDVEVEKFGW